MASHGGCCLLPSVLSRLGAGVVPCLAAAAPRHVAHVQLPLPLSSLGRPAHTLVLLAVAYLAPARFRKHILDLRGDRSALNFLGCLGGFPADIPKGFLA